MSQYVLEATKRDVLKKEASKKYRREGFIPATMYGQGVNRNLLINSKDFGTIYPKLTKATVITVNFDGKQYETLIKDYDKNYLKGNFLHLDFYELKKGKDVTVTVPLKFVGTPVGIKKGGTLEVHSDKIQIECKPADIVDHFDVDVSQLDINQNIHFRDMKLDAKYKVITHLDEVIVTLPGATTEAVTPAATATAAPATPAK